MVRRVNRENVMIMVHSTRFWRLRWEWPRGGPPHTVLPWLMTACWDTRRVIVDPDGTRHDFPFSNFFGALPAEVADASVKAMTVLA